MRYYNLLIGCANWGLPCNHPFYECRQIQALYIGRELTLRQIDELNRLFKLSNCPEMGCERYFISTMWISPRSKALEFRALKMSINFWEQFEVMPQYLVDLNK